MPQRETLEAYTALKAIQPNWQGTLILSIGLHQPLAFAALAAGAATLILEADPTRIKEANRAGATTFTVTTLDEALRALKNEIRQGRAITVALTGHPTEHLHHLRERGVQPQHTYGDSNFQDLTAARPHHHIAEDKAATLQQRRSRDTQLLAAATTSEDRTWLQAAPRLFPRALIRAHWQLNG